MIRATLASALIGTAIAAPLALDLAPAAHATAAHFESKHRHLSTSSEPIAPAGYVTRSIQDTSSSNVAYTYASVPGFDASTLFTVGRAWQTGIAPIIRRYSYDTAAGTYDDGVQIFAGSTSQGTHWAAPGPQTSATSGTIFLGHKNAKGSSITAFDLATLEQTVVVGRDILADSGPSEPTSLSEWTDGLGTACRLGSDIQGLIANNARDLLYFIDYDHGRNNDAQGKGSKIRKYDSTTGQVVTVAGDGTNRVTTSGAPLQTGFGLLSSDGIALKPGDESQMYVLAWGFSWQPQNSNLICLLDMTAGTLNVLTPLSDAIAGVNAPQGMLAFSNALLMSANNNLLRLDLTSNALTTYVGTSSPTATTFGAGTSGGLYLPVMIDRMSASRFLVGGFDGTSAYVFEVLDPSDPNHPPGPPQPPALPPAPQPPALPPAPLPPALPPASGASGDPHLTFAHGGKADFRGTDKGLYNFLSAKNVSLNVMTELADFKLRGVLVHGSFMTQAHVVATSRAGRTVRASYWAHKIGSMNKGWMNGTIDGQPAFSMGPKSKKHIDDIALLMDYSSLHVVTPEFEIVIAPKAVYDHVAGPAKRLDVQVRRAEAEFAVPPHGIIGQSWDADLVAVNGKQDVYPRTGEFTTNAMAEGAIEGVAKDYLMPSRYATAYKYSRFGVNQALPRNVAELAGTHTAASLSSDAAAASEIA